MRGNVDRQQPMLVAFNIEERVPEDHPLRPIKQWCDRVLAKMSRDFTKAYGTTGRVGIPPERPITALLPESPTKIVEPFYFDARRFAHSLDTGFSLDTQEADTVAYPTVEILCLIGLQRCRPQQAPTSRWRFEYWTWHQPLCPSVAAAVTCGAVAVRTLQRYQFSIRFRDDQKRYKAFSFSTPIGDQP